MTEIMMTREDSRPIAQSTAAARRAMIDSQLRTSGVNEEFALARMISVPRENFLPAEKAALAYIDRSVVIDGGALASPLFYGKALLEAAPTSEDRVLVIGNGTQYLSALVEPLVASLDLVTASDGAAGRVSGNYTLVMIDGAIEQLPQAIADCVEDGGRIVSGLHLRQVTRLASGRKIAGQLTLQPIEDIGIPVLRDFDAPKKWTFS